jgi:hypothetical protein
MPPFESELTATPTVRSDGGELYALAVRISTRVERSGYRLPSSSNPFSYQRELLQLALRPEPVLPFAAWFAARALKRLVGATRDLVVGLGCMGAARRDSVGSVAVGTVADV